jgi:uncharacterized membrane protein YfcA
MELAFWVTAYFAAVFGTLASFGISSILLPVALSTFNYETALALVSIFHLFGNLGRLSFLEKGVDKRIVALFGAPAVLSTFIGARYIGVLNVNTGKTLVGLVLLIYSSLGVLETKLRFKPSTLNTVTGGVLYGLLSGLLGTDGPIRGSILIGFGLEPELYIATSGAISLMIDLTRVPVYLWRGFLDPQYMIYIPLMFIVALLGTYSSRFLVERLDTETFSKVVYIGILVLSLKLIYEGLII